jgi:hypothetical protein
MIHCFVCGGLISPLAPICIHCGNPRSAQFGGTDLPNNNYGGGASYGGGGVDSGFWLLNGPFGCLPIACVIFIIAVCSGLIGH